MRGPVKLIGIGVLTLVLASCGGADDDTPDPIAGTADTLATGVDQATDDVASAGDPVAAAPASNEVPERAAVLPQTASPLPFTALVGVISLAGAAGLRLWRRGRLTRDAADEGTA